MKIISLGWGVQSWTMAAMVAERELPWVDYVVNADTRHEASWTYQFAKRNKQWLADRGLNVVTVFPSEKKIEAFDKYGGIFIPAFTKNTKGFGQLRRQCTGDWKIAPMRRYFQTIRKGEQIELMIGISMDEIQRMRKSDVKYITNIYPLIDLRMSRQDCIGWLKDHGLEIPKRSACYFCPYHSEKEWFEIMRSEDKDKAIKYDEIIRNKRPPFDLFIHPSRKPIAQVDFRTPQEKGQLNLWDDECSGICGI